jgi:hypothetical protein
VVRVSRRVFQTLLPERPTPARCLEAYHLHRTRLELIAERKLRRRQLSGGGNVEITGRALAGAGSPATGFTPDRLSPGCSINANRPRSPPMGTPIRFIGWNPLRIGTPLFAYLHDSRSL